MSSSVMHSSSQEVTIAHIQPIFYLTVEHVKKCIKEILWISISIVISESPKIIGVVIGGHLYILVVLAIFSIGQCSFLINSYIEAVILSMRH